VLAQFASRAGALVQDYAARAWRAGQADVAAITGGAAPELRINEHALTATRYSLVRLLSDTSAQARQHIESAIAQHLIGVRSLTQTIDDIHRVLDGSTRRRAMTIAYTEIGRVYSAAQYESMLDAAQAIPALRKRWLHSHKEHARPGHVLAAQDDPIPVAQPFLIVDTKTGTTEFLRFPRDPQAGPGNTINCGCMMRAVLPDDPDEIFATPAPPAPVTA